jgi:hypothetical protein
MIEPWFHEIARQRHQELLVRAERYRLGRSICEPNAHRRIAPRQLNFLLGRAPAFRFRHAFRLLVTTESQASRERMS